MAAGGAFVKGGLGCIVTFAVAAGCALALGGSAHLDAVGVLLLFLMGGVVGLIVFAIYNKGLRDAARGVPPPVTGSGEEPRDRP
ncbi:MAG TPA: hypothetical protein VFI25_12700 [Planctomycetota bacterium]|nr:hypothetical protein [Planctomycetota bacterium]